MREVVAHLRPLGLAFELATEGVEIHGVRALRARVLGGGAERVHRTFGEIRALVEGASPVVPLLVAKRYV